MLNLLRWCMCLNVLHVSDIGDSFLVINDIPSCKQEPQKSSFNQQALCPDSMMIGTVKWDKELIKVWQITHIIISSVRYNHIDSSTVNSYGLIFHGVQFLLSWVALIGYMHACNTSIIASCISTQAKSYKQ